MKIINLLLISCIWCHAAFAGVCDTETKLLLHGNGTDASTSFPDSSLSAHSVTASGNAQVDTGQFKFGGASGSFLTSSYLTVPDSSDWDFGTASFTVDFWVRFASTATTNQITLSIGGLSNGITINTLNNGGVDLEIRITGTQYSSGWAPSADTWYHVAVVRDVNTLRLFIDGTSIGTHDVTGKNITSVASFTIAGNDGSFNDLNGWLDEIRVSKGIARWTSNFTPPTEEYCASSTASFFPLL